MRLVYLVGPPTYGALGTYTCDMYQELEPYIMWRPARDFIKVSVWLQRQHASFLRQIVQHIQGATIELPSQLEWLSSLAPGCWTL